ncbi:MAG: hypothetical protein ACRBHB_17170 [Arenicella sp.]
MKILLALALILVSPSIIAQQCMIDGQQQNTQYGRCMYCAELLQAEIVAKKFQETETQIALFNEQQSCGCSMLKSSITSVDAPCPLYIKLNAVLEQTK